MPFLKFLSYFSSTETEKLYQCDVCGEVCRSRNHFRYHKKTAHLDGQRPFACDLCPATFKDFGGLKSHKIIHSSNRPFQCELCHATFARIQTLTMHKKAHSSQNERPYECDICPKKFISRYKLDIHKRRHSGERPYACPLCQAKFHSSYALTRHKKFVHQQQDKKISERGSAVVSAPVSNDNRNYESTADNYLFHF